MSLRAGYRGLSQRPVLDRAARLAGGAGGAFGALRALGAWVGGHAGDAVGAGVAAAAHGTGGRRRRTVHIGARVAALAGPGEVLVSSTVRDIVTGSRRTFVERGEYELKGVPDRWRVYALVREQTTITG